ncbi:MAG: hypothetical protein QOD86_2287 [Miltoncostaeaceae bacterium]|jgi:hypothetical protein|nr:hypothetical protein [Miltoncostaeaceae bacterium]
MTAPAPVAVPERTRHLRAVGAVEDRTGSAEPSSPWPGVVAEERRGETRLLIAIFAVVAALIVVAIAWGLASVGATP